MAKDYVQFAKEADSRAAALFKAAPDTMKAFRQFLGEATKAGAVDVKTKELIAVAIAIVIRCDGCIVFHTRAALRHGVTREEFVETIGVAIEMGGGPSSVYGAQALEIYDQMASAAKG